MKTYPVRNSAYRPIRPTAPPPTLPASDASTVARWRIVVAAMLGTFLLLTLAGHINGGGFFGPTASTAYIVTVDDFKLRTTDTGIELARFLSDGDYWAKIETAGHAYRQLDINNQAATQPYTVQLLKHGTPLMLIMSNDPPTKGTILWEGKIPTGPPADTEKWLDDILSQRIKK